MASKLVEFVEQFIMDTFLLKLTEFEITFMSLGYLIINFHFRN